MNNMTTTDLFRISPDFFGSPQEARIKPDVHQTNPRYKGFNQTHFTAGDPEQFDQYRYLDDMKSTSRPQPTVTSGKLWEKYRDLPTSATTNTFNYMFHKFKKGIFVKIKDGELKVFLPFSNANYYNEWSSQIDVTGFMDLVKRITEGEGYVFKPKRINRNVDEWYGNNCLMRYEFPLSEGDTNVGNVRNMMVELCNERKIPDVEFFINRRDFPMLMKDGTEPYEEIWGRGKPLVSHSYDKYTPILSMSTCDRFADVAIPNHNDWARIQSKQSKWFPVSTSDDFDDSFDKVAWNKKIPTAVFRGSSTGKGVTISTNKRLKAAYMSLTQTHLDNAPRLLDAGITSWNLRSRKLDGFKKLQTIDRANLPFELVTFMNCVDQSQYKYILHIEGHVAAFRLSSELATRSVVLKVASEWKVWYEDKLVEYVHYVPVKSDLSDLMDQIRWCRDNDDKCRAIADNARAFYEKWLCRDGVLDSLQTLLTDLAVHTPVYNSRTDTDILIEYERASLVKTKESLSDVAIVNGRHVLSNISDVTKPTVGDVATDNGVIFTSKLSTINKWLRNDNTYSFVIKTSNDIRKTREHVHEAYIGTHVTNELSQHIPNFAYVFGLTDKESVVIEHIDGVTLHSYINSNAFNFDDFKIILTQVSLAVKMAYHRYMFVHNDLTPWNIILYKHSKGPMSVKYEVGPNKYINVTSSMIPVLIDFGKSTAVVQSVRHGIVNSRDTSTIQDILTLILTSCKTILATQRTPQQFSQTIHMFNFLAGNKYLTRPVKTSFEIKSFLQRHSKYSQLISDNKFDLENLDALDFVKYLGVVNIHR